MPEKIRLGLIGASVKGTWSARSHLPALKACSDIELTAVCTTKPDSAEAARQAHGARLAFHDYHELAASSEIDAVAVVVRVPSHYAPTKAALQAGKHVYCEWPLGRTTEEAIELTALGKKNGLTTAIGLQARVNPPLMYLKDLLTNGYVGVNPDTRYQSRHPISKSKFQVKSRGSGRHWEPGTPSPLLCSGKMQSAITHQR